MGQPIEVNSGFVGNQRTVVTFDGAFVTIRRGLLGRNEARIPVSKITMVGYRRQAMKGGGQIEFVAAGLDGRVKFTWWKANDFDRLREWRSERAREEEIAAFMVFSNATLEEIATRRPQTTKALLAVSGVGPEKLQKYGDEPDRDRLRPRPASDVRKRPYPTILRLVCNRSQRFKSPWLDSWLHPLGGEDQAGVAPAESGCQPLWTVSVPIGCP